MATQLTLQEFLGKAIQKEIESQHLYIDLSQKVNELAAKDAFPELAREHSLMYQLTERQRGGAKTMLSKLPKELQEPMSSVAEFSDALLIVLRRGTARWSSHPRE